MYGDFIEIVFLKYIGLVNNKPTIVFQSIPNDVVAKKRIFSLYIQAMHLEYYNIKYNIRVTLE